MTIDFYTLIRKCIKQGHDETNNGTFLFFTVSVNRPISLHNGPESSNVMRKGASHCEVVKLKPESSKTKPAERHAMGPARRFWSGLGRGVPTTYSPQVCARHSMRKGRVSLHFHKKKYLYDFY